MDSNHRLRDFRTTIVFTTLSVCGLDYTFIIPFGLDVPRLVSTPSSYDAWLGIAILQVSPNLRNYTHKVSQMRLNFHKSLASAAGLHGRVWDHYNSKSPNSQCSLLELNQSISCYEQGAIYQMDKRAFAIRK